MECPICELAGAPDGLLLPAPPGLLAAALPGGAPVAGWCVVTPREHTESFSALPRAMAAAMMETAHRIAAAQRDGLGAEKSYVALFSEVVPHVHLHVIPRAAGAPAELRGAAVFAAGLPRVADAESLAALRALRGRLSGEGAR